MKLKKNPMTITALYLLSFWAGFLPALNSAQTPAAAQNVFPEQLLEGNPNFQFALLLQGDARGNVGPCG